jgi:hypothetical protein
MIRDAIPDRRPNLGTLPSLGWCNSPVRVVPKIRDPGHEHVEETVLVDRYRVETRFAEGDQSGTAVSQ